MGVNSCVFIALAVLCGLCAAELEYFWHFSDTHMQSDYYEGSNPKEGCFKGKGNAGKFGDYECRSPYPVEYTASNEMEAIRPKEVPDKDPMFILWTGDSVAKRGGVITEDVIKWDLKNLTHVFTKMYNSFNGKVPLYPVLGNHDAYPQHQMAAKDDWVYHYVADLWEPFLPKSAVATLRTHGYYSLKIKKDLRLIVLNTVLYYIHNAKTKNEKDPGGQIAWMRSQLKEAKENKENVYIAGHVPVRGTGGCFQGHFEQPFLEGMEGYHSIIKGSFWGHCHKDVFQLFGNTSSGDFHVAHLASTLVSGGHKDPSFRHYIIDTKKDYEIQNWRTFYMDLPAVNKAGKIKWDVLYDAQTSYGIPDCTPQSVLGLAKKMKTDSKLFETVYKHHTGGAHTGECNESCQKRFICTILHASTKAYDKCAGV